MVHGGTLLMGHHNGHVYLELYRRIFSDLQSFYPELRRDLLLDVATIECRYVQEGLGFFTKTLPRFGKAIDLALSSGGRLIQSEFHKSGRTGLPAFLRGFLRGIFEFDGRLRENVEPGFVLEVRQICYLLYKLELPYDDAVIQEKTEAFVDFDDSLSFDVGKLSRHDRGIFAEAQALLDSLLRTFSLKGLKPHHGPGAVAGGEKPWDKMHFKHFVRQINAVFPIRSWFYLSPRHLTDELESFFDLERVESLTSRLEFVPKDSRGPRLIAMEPLEYMWIQQAIKDKLYDFVEQAPLTKGHVNFTDQEVNRSLALSSSLSGEYATLDMKDASDSVSLSLVEGLFGRTPIIKALLATRSPGVQLPNGEVHIYKKFAPMGSALCFPIEALTFWSLAVATIHKSGLPLHLALKEVFVYGDDIIVPTQYAETLINTFPRFQLSFNLGKCSVTGPFRESCGCDAVHGVDVTPIKVKRQIFAVSSAQNGNRACRVTDPRAILSWCEISNSFFERGYYGTALFVQELVEGLLGPLPVVGDLDYPLTWRARTSPSGSSGFKTRYNSDLHVQEVHTWTVLPLVYQHEASEDWSPIFSSILQGSKERGPEWYAIPRRIRLVKRWVQIPGYPRP